MSYAQLLDNAIWGSFDGLELNEERWLWEWEDMLSYGYKSKMERGMEID